MRLLLVEDEHAIRTALTRGLSRWGHQVWAAADCAAARELAAEHRPEALVSDLKLPDGSGLDLAVELGLRFVLMSGYGNFEDAVVALRNGCVDFLTKPVALEALKGAVMRLGERAGSAGAVWAQGPELVSPTAGHLSREAVHLVEVTWLSADEAAAAWQRLDPDRVDLRQRQLTAELMQAAPAGRLVVNRGQGWWRAWLDAGADWAASQHDDRRGLIDHLADQVWWRPEGVLVECHDAA